jgi:hypothetical protein
VALGLVSQPYLLPQYRQRGFQLRALLRPGAIVEGDEGNSSIVSSDNVSGAAE